MTDKKILLDDIQPGEPEPAPLPFDFAYICAHWLALTAIPLGAIPILREGESVPEVAVVPQAVWLIEVIELEDDQGVLLGEFGIKLSTMAGGDAYVILDTEQSIGLEKSIRSIAGQLGISQEALLKQIRQGRKEGSNLIQPPWKH